MAGMPRRIPDYPDAFAGWNVIASYGSWISFFGLVFFFYIVYDTFTGDRRVGDNPWVWDDLPADKQTIHTLEWLVSSPPAFHTFDELPNIKETLPRINK
jgi:heme/copper-type cytochrome/quinol oxidase subunit 1